MAGTFLTLCLLIGGSVQQSSERILVIGGWDYGEAVFDRAAGELGMKARFVATEATASVTVEDLVGMDLVFLLNLEPQGAAVLQGRLAEARKRKPSLKVLALDERETQKGIERAGLLVRDPDIRRYWRYNGLENTRRLLEYVRVKHLGKPGAIHPPVLVPDHGVYHPKAPDLFRDVAAYEAWARKNGHFVEGAPRVALMVQQSFLVTGDTKVYEAILSALERRKLNAAVVFAREPKKQQILLDAWKPDLLIDDAHASPSLKVGAEQRDIPMLKSVALLRSTVDEWQASPQGMLPADVGLHFLTQEVHGIIDPVVVGGLKANVGGYKLHEPIPERVDRLADRAVSWLTLRRKQNNEKKIAIIYYHKYLGQSDVGRGSATGSFLDAPKSLYRLLAALKKRGFTINRMPRDAAELLDWMKRDGRNIGVWAPGDLAGLVRDGRPVLVPAERYERWFARLSEANRTSVCKAYGDSPGTQMVWRDGKQQALVVPRLDLGNVILLPQPARGPENDEKLLHARDVPPPHQYLACYWWLQEEFHADAVIHFGTHGTELLLPGKANGMSKDDFADTCLGNMPNIYPWIIDNLAEAMLAKRRAYAVTVDHLCPPLEAAGLSPELQNLHEDIHKFETLEAGLLKDRYRKTISAAARKASLTTKAEDLTDKEIEEITLQLHLIETSVTAVKLHTLGEEPDDHHRVPFLVSMLGRSFLEELARVLPVPTEIAQDSEHREVWTRRQAEAMVRSMVDEHLTPREALQLGGARIPKGDPGKVEATLALAVQYRLHFARTGREIENVLRALEGKFVSPGPGADPVRNPGAIPTGRNLYSLNPEQVPTKQAWDVGVALVDELLKKKPLRKVAFDLNAFETMRDFGVTEAQVLYLMGVRPVWNHNNLAVDVEIIPRQELKRPRVDVFLAISGSMRDNFPSRVKLLDKAVRLVSDLDEADNLVRQGTQARAAELRQQGFSDARVRQFAPARIFGTKPGEYGTRILYLVPKTGAWDDRSEIASVYKEQMSYVFTGDSWGEKVPGLYESAIKDSETVLRTWTSNMTGPLTNHHVYEYAGGLSLAIESVSGQQPALMLNDVRDKPRIRDFQEVLTTEAHVTMLNPKWIRGMMENGYSGAGMMAEVVRNASGWQATRRGSISQAMWDDIHAVYVKDKHRLGVREWMNQTNPHARQEILATMLEAARKGDWQADEETRRDLARDYARSVAEHGDSGGLATGGNKKLQTEVLALLDAPADPDLAAVGEKYQTALRQSETIPATAAPAPKDTTLTENVKTASEVVSGNELTPVETRAPSAMPTGWNWMGFAVGAAVLFFLLLGALRSKGGA